MKKEDTIKIVKDKKILAGIAALLLLVAVILCVAAVKQNVGRRTGGMASLLAEQMENSGFSYLPGEKRELETVAEAAAEFLDELVSTGADHQEMIERLQEYLLGLDWGLTEEQAAELAEWLVNVYLQNYESVYGKPSGVGQTVTELSDTFLEEMRTDLESISEYLTRLDEAVTNNRTELENLTVNKNGDGEGLQEYLDSLAETVTGLQENIASLERGFMEAAGSSNTGLSNVSALLGTIYESIANTQNEILVDLANAGLDSRERYESIQSSVSSMTASVITEVEEVGDSVDQVLNDLLADNDENTASIIKDLQESRTTITTLLEELESTSLEQFWRMEENSAARYASLTEELSFMQDSLKTVLEEMRTESSAQNAELTHRLETVYEQISAALSEAEQNNEERFQMMGENLQNVYDGLSAALDSLGAKGQEQYESLTASVHAAQDVPLYRHIRKQRVMLEQISCFPLLWGQINARH